MAFQGFGQQQPILSPPQSQQVDPQHLFGLFSNLRIDPETQTVYDPSNQSAVHRNEDIDLTDIQPREQRLTKKQQRRLREAQRKEELAAEKATQPAKAKPVKSKQARTKVRFQKRRNQQLKLDAINRDPVLKSLRTDALKKLHSAAQEYHTAIENRAQLRKDLQSFCDYLARHTEKSADELFNEFLQTDLDKSAAALTQSPAPPPGPRIKPLRSSAGGSLDAFGLPPPKRVDEAKKAREAEKTKKQLEKTLNPPKFALFEPSREQKIRNVKLWKIAKPRVIDLILALQANADIARPYAAARIPIKNISGNLQRSFEEVLSELVPQLTKERITLQESRFSSVLITNTFNNNDGQNPKEQKPKQQASSRGQQQPQQQHHQPGQAPQNGGLGFGSGGIRTYNALDNVPAFEDVQLGALKISDDPAEYDSDEEL
jgi:hypothetical protein